MSKINQIEQALFEIDGGEFQKLADLYLAEKGFKNVNSIGSVIGTNKVRKGTPDSLVMTPDGKFIFAEYTAQQNSLFEKLQSDLKKCLDESRTGIPIDKVERIIFCFTGKLSSSDEYKLSINCHNHGIKLDLFGINTIASDLYIKFPALARDFLGISIDTGQIVSPDRFVSVYNSNKLAAKLDTGFHFREKEICSLLDALENEKVVVISGPAGVGKSRLALEACRRFNERHPKYEVLCVFGRNRDLWEDLQARFLKPGSFLILVDDANRISRFSYIVDLLQHQREDQQIKVIVTVRDYAIVKLRDEMLPIGGGAEIELSPFTDDQIKKLIADEYGIRNYFYLERIAEISHGNPRLAVMAAEIAKQNSLDSIYDVSSLYDIYFSSIRKDLVSEGTDPGKTDLLKVAAIVSFFKAVDRTNDAMMKQIEEAFGIIPSSFWEAAGHLHEIEILDMYEDEVVRMPDQVLSTYLFYLAFFKEEVLDFGMLLDYFFPKLRHRIIDSINPILSAFNKECIIDAIHPHVGRLWKKFEAANDEESLINLLEVFGFINRTDTLLWVQNQIDRLKPDPVDISSIIFEKDSKNLALPPILSVLKPFAIVQESEVRVALDLLLHYLMKKPAEVPLVLRILIDDYGFKPDSYLREFEIQRAVIDVLEGRLEHGNPLFSRVFLAVASNYLGTHFESIEMKDARSFQITNFDLKATSELILLRKNIWQQLKTLYEYRDLQNIILRLIRNYCKPTLSATDSEIVRSDAEQVLPFLESILNPCNYQHCVLMYDYLNFLSHYKIKISDDLKEWFHNDTYKIAEIVLPEWGEQRRLNLSYEEYEQYKNSQLAEFTASYTLDDYARFIECCQEIQATLSEGQNKYYIQRSLVSIFISLADRDADLFVRVIGMYLEYQDPLQINSPLIIEKLLDHLGRDGTLQFLRKPKYPTKNKWLFVVFMLLREKDINEKVLAQLYELYEQAAWGDLPYNFDYLLRYIFLDERVVAKVTSIVLKKQNGDSTKTDSLAMLFNPNAEVAKCLPSLFADNLDLLEQAYLMTEGISGQIDYDGQALNRILNLDPAFITEYIAWKYENAGQSFLTSHDDQKDYAFIWARNDYKEIMDKVVESVYSREQDPLISTSTYLIKFFQIKDNRNDALEEIRERQNIFLMQLINDRSTEMGFIKYIFRVISYFSPDRRCMFIEQFVKQNQSFEAFKALPLEPSLWSWRESQVPLLQERINFWKLLIPIMNTADLLKHKQFLEQQIQLLRLQIEQEKKKDFIED